jgi:hypothetical protein
MFPVYLYEDDTELPAQGEYYVVAGNGIWFRKQTDVFTGFIPLSSICFLKDFDDANEAIKCMLPKIPHDIVMMVKKFFVQVFKKHHSEACVILYYNKEFGQYSICVPRQWNSHGAVHYIRPSLKLPPGPTGDTVGSDSILPLILGLPVGTIHSHCDFSAFHSGVDQQDESTFDGIHVTFGDITNPAGMSVMASFVLNNGRCCADPLLVLEGIVKVNETLYKIIPPEREVDYNAWATEVDSWVAKVNVGDPPHPWTEKGIIAWKEKNGHQED